MQKYLQRQDWKPEGYLIQQNCTCGPIQLLDLCFVSVNEELVQVVLGRGLVVVPP